MKLITICLFGLVGTIQVFAKDSVGEDVVFEDAPIAVKSKDLPMYMLPENLSLNIDKENYLYFSEASSPSGKEFRAVSLVNQKTDICSYLPSANLNSETAVKHNIQRIRNQAMISIENARKWNETVPNNPKIAMFRDGKLIIGFANKLLPDNSIIQKIKKEVAKLHSKEAQEKLIELNLQEPNSSHSNH